MYGLLLSPDLKKLTIQYAYNIYQKSILKDLFQNVLEECTDLSLSKHVYWQVLLYQEKSSHKNWKTENKERATERKGSK